MNDRYIWDYLLLLIGNPFGVAGLIGNLYAESGLRPYNLQNTYEKKLGMTDWEYTNAVTDGSYTAFSDDRAGYGIAQWTYPSRKAALLAYAKEKDAPICDLDMQLEFLWKELQNYSSVLETLKNASSIREASDAVMLKFECPKDTSLTAKMRRSDYGQYFYDLYAKDESSKGGGGMNEFVEKLIKMAENEVGYLEKNSNAQLDEKTANAGQNKNYTKYARDLNGVSWFNGNKQGAEWCAVFVSWLFYQMFGKELGMKLLCQPTKDNCAAGCGSARGYFNSHGQLYNDPEPGDQVFFWKSDLSEVGHTGLVVEVTNTTVYTIEGNTSDGSQVIANGGAVCRKNYPLGYKRIAGYGRPDWSLVTSEPDLPVESALYEAVVQADNNYPVKMRASASTNSDVLAIVPLGTVVPILEEVNETWAKIRYGQTGFMMRKFLSKVQNDPAEKDKSGNKFDRLVDLLHQAYFLAVEINEERGE